MIIKGKHKIYTQENNEVVKYGKYICGRNKEGDLYKVKEVEK